MYTQLWNKYLPIIKILLKRSLKGEQTLNLNVTDFERAGIARKGGSKFVIGFSKGKADNVIASSPLAKDLSTTLLQDAILKDLFLQNDYQITMNTKYQLVIKCIPVPMLEDEVTTEAVHEEAAVAF